MASGADAIVDAVLRGAPRRARDDAIEQLAAEIASFLRWRFCCGSGCPPRWPLGDGALSGWQLDRVSPAGSSVAGTIVITLYGADLACSRR